MSTTVEESVLVETPDRATTTTPGSGDDVSLLGLANAVLRHRRLLVVLPLALAFVVGVSSLLRDRAYSARTTFLPQGSDASGGTVSILGRQLGIDIGAGAPGQSPAFYAYLVTSRAILEELIHSEFTWATEEGTVTRPLLDVFAGGGATERERLRRAIDRLAESLVVRVNGPTGLVEIEAKAPDPILAEQILGRVLELINRFNVEQRQSQAAAEARFAGERLETARQEMLEAEDELRSFLEENARFELSPRLQLEYSRLTRRLAMRERLHATLAESYEQARIQQVRNTPVITVVERPEGSGRPMARGTVLRVAVALVAGFVLALLVAFLRDASARLSASGADEYRAFLALRREAAADLRWPVRALARVTTRRRSSAAALDETRGE
ncbi:MAG TPA: hypothetical protein VF212_03335 [Longimicrobiales bacterium]